MTGSSVVDPSEGSRGDDAPYIEGYSQDFVETGQKPSKNEGPEFSGCGGLMCEWLRFLDIWRL